jgi:hypothetical protein
LFREFQEIGRVSLTITKSRARNLCLTEMKEKNRVAFKVIGTTLPRLGHSG